MTAHIPALQALPDYRLVEVEPRVVWLRCRAKAEGPATGRCIASAVPVEESTGDASLKLRSQERHRAHR